MRLDFPPNVRLGSDQSRVFRAGTGEDLRCQEHRRDEIRKSDADRSNSPSRPARDEPIAGHDLIANRRRSSRIE